MDTAEHSESTSVVQRATLALRSQALYVCLAAAWIVLWIIPWRDIPTLPGISVAAVAADLVRIGLELFVFLVPGALLYVLLRSDDERLEDTIGGIPIAFTLSVFLIGIVGLAARLLGASFTAVVVAVDCQLIQADRLRIGIVVCFDSAFHGGAMQTCSPSAQPVFSTRDLVFLEFR